METTGTLSNSVREVKHCPECGSPLIRLPILICAHCGEERPLRCYWYRSGSNSYIAECVDLDLLSQGDTLEAAIGKLQESMHGYLEVAFEGESTKGLVLRLSPLSHRLRYYYHKLKCWFSSRIRGLHGKHFLPATPELVKRYLSHC